MTLKPADMNDCSPKKLCLSGDNEGIAYDPSDPCPVGQEFDPLTCNCTGCSSSWLITFQQGTGDPGYGGCNTELCAPKAEVVILQAVYDFGGTCATPIGGVHFCSISGSCPHGPVNCEGTWESRYGWKDIYFQRGEPIPGSQAVFCGQSDLVLAEFVTSSSDRYEEGDRFAAYLAAGWGGAVGCCFYQNKFISAVPVSCEAPVSATVYWKVSFATYSGDDCTPTTTLCFGFGGNPYSTRVTDLMPGAQIEVFTETTGEVGSCSGTQNTTVAIRYYACSNGNPILRTQTIGAPGCSVNTSAGAIATPYDVSVVYD